MGKTLLILLAGFAVSFGILAGSKNRRLVEAVDRSVNQFANYSTKNAAASGVYMALQRLYLDPAWRAGYSNLALAGNAINVTVEDQSAVPALGPHRIRIRSAGGNGSDASLSQVTAFGRGFQGFAVWAKDTVISVSTRDSLGNVDPGLLIQNAPFMPTTAQQNLVDAASAQGHVKTASLFTPEDGYPNGSFYRSGSTPNVTQVKGNLKVKHDRTIYGIFLVEGDILIEGGATVKGVLCLPKPSSWVNHNGSEHDASLVKGGIVTWGAINGTGGNLSVRHFPAYINAFVNNYAPDNPPIRVLSWQ